MELEGVSDSTFEFRSNCHFLPPCCRLTIWAVDAEGLALGTKVFGHILFTGKRPSLQPQQDQRMRENLVKQNHFSGFLLGHSLAGSK